MNPLQIHIIAGAQAGARLQLNQSPVTFGRSADCTLILDLPVVSRLHGELQIDETGQWVLVNHSTNGTRVGRKKATKKPIPLTDGVSINIGDTEVFRVHLSTPTEEEHQDNPDQDDAQTQQAPGAGMKGKSKLWIGLGIWFGLCLAAMIFFATLGGGDDNSKHASGPRFYNPSKEVEGMTGKEAGVTAIRRLLAEPPVFQDPNATRYSEHLDRATRAADLGTAELYNAYKNYQLAISYSSNRELPDTLRYKRILDELAEIIYTRYTAAFHAYHEGKYQEARDILERLRRDFYAVDSTEDPLANHIRKLRNAAHRRAK